MATVGELAVNIIARTKPFEQGMKRSADSMKRLEEASGKASKKVTELDGGISRISGSLKGLVANAAAAAAGMVTLGAVFAGVKNRMAELDALAKQSDRIGMNMQNLQAMGFAAEQSGIAFDRFSSIMDGFAKRMGEAKLGMGEAKTVLDQLGISAAKFTSMPLDQQIGTLADIIQSNPSHAARMGITTKLFEDPAMLNLLSQGSEGIGELMDQAKSLGVVSRSSAADIEKANDAMNRMQKSIRGLTDELAVSVAPAVTASANWLTETVRMTRVGALGIAESVGHWLELGSIHKPFWETPGLEFAQKDFARRHAAELGTPRIVEMVPLGDILQREANRDALGGLGRLMNRAAAKSAESLQQLAEAAETAARPLGEMASGVMDRLIQQGQQFQMMSGLRNLAGFGASFASLLMAPAAGADLSSMFQMHGTSADNRAILRGSREDIDREQNRAREKQLEIERQQLKALQDAVRALTDPGKILSFLSLDGGPS